MGASLRVLDDTNPLTPFHCCRIWLGFGPCRSRVLNKFSLFSVFLFVWCARRLSTPPRPTRLELAHMSLATVFPRERETHTLSYPSGGHLLSMTRFESRQGHGWPFEGESADQRQWESYYMCRDCTNFILPCMNLALGNEWQGLPRDLIRIFWGCATKFLEMVGRSRNSLPWVETYTCRAYSPTYLPLGTVQCRCGGLCSI